MDGDTGKVEDTPKVSDSNGLEASSSGTTTTTIASQEQTEPDSVTSSTASNPQNQEEEEDDDHEDSNILECPICLQACVHPVELPCSHIFCFLCIKGVAAQTQGNNRCAICRQNIPNNVLTNPRLKDVSQLYKDPKLSNGFQWYYESRGGGWWMYDERTMQELEKAYDSKLPTCRVLIAGHMYEIDFGQMIQYRMSNPSLFRRIKRDYGTVEKRGIAGIRLNNQGSNSHESGAAGGPSNQRGSHLPGSAEIFEIDTDDDDDECEDEEDVDEDDMDLEEEEDIDDSQEDDQGESGDSEGEGPRDGARAPTRRSDRSNSSNNQTPPSTPSGQNGSYSQLSGRGSRCGGVSRNMSNSRNSTSPSSSENNSETNNVDVGSESGNIENRQASSTVSSSSSAAPSSVNLFDIDELNVNAPLDNNGSLSYIIIGSSSSNLQIRLQYNSNNSYEMDEIL